MTVDEALAIACSDEAEVLAAEVCRLRAKYEPQFSLPVHHDECSTIDEALTRADVAHRAGWTRANQAEVVLAAEVHRLRENNKALGARLARVEDWYRRTTSSDPDELCDAMDELGNQILFKDPS